jgi:hypothetical protein
MWCTLVICHFSHLHLLRSLLAALSKITSCIDYFELNCQKDFHGLVEDLRHYMSSISNSADVDLICPQVTIWRLKSSLFLFNELLSEVLTRYFA